VRRATDLRRQVWRLVNEQRDLLSREAIEAIDQVDRKAASAIESGVEPAALEKVMAELEKVANERLLPYPNGSIRENTKEILVAVTVIFAFTTFFLQLTKIPTNSLLPTLYGITSQDLRNQPDVKVPGPLMRFVEYWVHGVSYYHVVAETDGVLKDFEPKPRLVFPFVKQQRLLVGDQWYTVWLPPEQLEGRAGLHPGEYFRAGQDIIKLRVVSGDHLLVDRFTYNFRRPKRGEIFVFKTTGIGEEDPATGVRNRPEEGQLYIKRLVALGGEHVRIGNDQHLIINGRRLDASTPHFEKVYSFDPVFKENHYFGHVNQLVASRYGRNLAPLFTDETCEHVVAPHHYLAMGDNTMNSFDSRAWGDVPCQNVIGKCWFVYWPFTDRFGWHAR
jgi:signal peptidase I